jgi:hypothetical protein
MFGTERNKANHPPNPEVRSRRKVQCHTVNTSARPDLWVRICHCYGLKKVKKECSLPLAAKLLYHHYLSTNLEAEIYKIIKSYVSDVC